MYVVIKKEPLKILLFEAKTDLADYLKVHRHTITNKFSTSSVWEYEKDVIYKVTTHHKRKRSGNKDSREERVKKQGGKCT